MTRRDRAGGGFTLLELMVAIVVTGVVALLAYGTAGAAFDTSERLERYRATVEARVIVRALLLDALRHPPDEGGAAMNDLLFIIDDRTSGEGLPIDGVRFLSRGITPPLGSSATWSVTLEPSRTGVRLLAVPAGASDATPIDALLAGVRGLSVRVLHRAGDSTWRDTWDVAGRVPAAVALEFLGEGNAPVAPPLVVHSALETAPDE